MDFERYSQLHTIAMLRDVVRKWWQAELGFADKNGTVVDWTKGQIHPPPNDFCRLALFSAEGMKRCTSSIRVLHEKFRGTRKLKRSQYHVCHMGFTIIGAPILINGDYEGMLFVEGFARQPLSAAEADIAKSKIREVNDGATDLARAVERVPILSNDEFEKLSDLLEFGANDISAFETELSKKNDTIQTLASELSEKYRFENIIGRSAPMLEVFRILQRVCNSESTVLVNGESGTGKELVARAIHFNGPRAKKPFVVQNCSALNDNLLESALFGHTRGAFTGAVRDTKGLFEIADGGTFFLDEVGDMSPTLQVKLLRVLQEGTFTPVGSNAVKHVDVRVIAATHKDLAEAVGRGQFREDLYYRINVIRITVPPLRARKDDMPLLLEHFLRKHHREGQRARGLTPEAFALLQRYHWPGNIREFENEIERLLVLGGDEELIGPELVSQRITDAVQQAAPAAPPVVAALQSTQDLNEAVELLERAMIGDGLKRTHNNKSRLARELGISRSNLILKIAKYKLEAPDEGAEDDA